MKPNKDGGINHRHFSSIWFYIGINSERTELKYKSKFELIIKNFF